MANKKVVVLLSGGLDSATCFFEACAHSFDVYPLSFDYNQRHKKELEAAKLLVEAANRRWAYELYALPRREHRVIKLDLGNSASALTRPDIDVPTDRDESKMSEDIPVTYVPARNSVFLSLAFGYAESIGASEVWTGINAVDYSGYPDCRPEFAAAMEVALNLGSKRVQNKEWTNIHAPLIYMSKADIARRASSLDVPIHMTWSCYQGGEKPCGVCDSCVIRDKALKEAGFAHYASR